MRLKEFRQNVRAFIQFQPESELSEEKAPTPPYEMHLIWQCEKYGVLPYKGGLLEQPHILMMLFDIIHTERAEWEKLKRLNQKLQAQWSESSNARKTT